MNSKANSRILIVTTPIRPFPTGSFRKVFRKGYISRIVSDNPAMEKLHSGR